MSCHIIEFESKSSISTSTFRIRQHLGIHTIIFGDCSMIILTDIYYGSNMRDWEAITVGTYNDSLSSATIHYTKILTHVLTLPSALTTIESEAFADLSAVDGIRIPETVTSIAEDAFRGSDITILTPIGSYAAQWAEAHGIPVVTE